MRRRLVRGLTANEARIASLLFGDAVDCARVRVHGRRSLPLVQPNNCAMAPSGSIHFHPSCFLPDYTAGDPHTITGSCTRWCSCGGLRTTFRSSLWRCTT